MFFGLQNTYIKKIIIIFATNVAFPLGMGGNGWNQEKETEKFNQIKVKQKQI